MVTFDYRATFSDTEYVILCRGLVPVEMEDKWFVFLEAHTLYFHRSWTGHCVYQLEMQATPTSHDVVRAMVASDHDMYHRSSDQYEAAMVDFLLRGLLLHQAVAFPLPAGLRSAPPGLFQHHIAGTGFPEQTFGPPGRRVVDTLRHLLKLLVKF
jgi:hypothetical protein